MQNLIREVAATGAPAYFVAASHPRLVEGQPSKNPRYLQLRPDLVQPRKWYLADMAMRLEKLLGTSAESWLRMQEAVDLWEARQQPEKFATIKRLQPMAAVAA